MKSDLLGKAGKLWVRNLLMLRAYDLFSMLMFSACSFLSFLNSNHWTLEHPVDRWADKRLSARIDISPSLWLWSPLLVREFHEPFAFPSINLLSLSSIFCQAIYIRSMLSQIHTMKLTQICYFTIRTNRAGVSACGLTSTSYELTNCFWYLNSCVLNSCSRYGFMETFETMILTAVAEIFLTLRYVNWYRYTQVSD